MKATFKNRFLPVSFVVFTALFATLTSPGCSDNPVTEDHDEHAEPVGIVVFENDTEIARVEKGIVTGAFNLRANQRSPLYTLEFLDEDGDQFIPDDPDFSPGEIIANPSILTLERNQPSDWNFYLLGTAEGSTTIQLTVKHGGHNDYVSVAIPVVVQP